MNPDFVPIVPEESRGGNSISPLFSPQINPAVAWCFTFNNYDNQNVPLFQELIKKNCKIGFFNKEVGASGTPHLQGYIEFLKKDRPLSVFKNFKIHWSKAKGNKDANFKYCSKDAIDDNMTFIHGVLIKPSVKVIKDLRPFQQQLLNICLGDVNEGKIIWVYDPKGQLGKTEFLRFMYVKYGMPFTYGGKCSDIINLAFNNKDYLMNSEKAVMIYNFGKETKPDRISYKSMEQISDGAISNTKFETGCFVCNKPHVVVLANCMPNIECLTESRWIIKTIDENLNLIDYA